MFTLYAEVVSRSQPDKNESDDVVESDTIETLYLLRDNGDEETNANIDIALYESCHLILLDVFRLFASQCDDHAFQRLGQVEALSKEFGSDNAKKFVGFHINRFRAFGYSWSDAHLKAVKASNKAIAHCPIVNGARAKGLVDILILISDSYSAMNKNEDAVYSAKLAVDIAHDQLEKSVDEIFVNGVEGKSIVGGVRTYLGPLLDNNLLLIFAYFNLATQLRHGDMVESSITWYEKAIQTAESNRIDEDIISVLFAGLNEAEKYLNENVDSGMNIQAHDTVVGDRISNGIGGLDTQLDDGHGHKHGGLGKTQIQSDSASQQSQRSSQQGNKNKISSGESSRNRQNEYATGPKRKSSEETSMTSSERNGPAHSNDGDEHDIYEDVPHGTKGMLYPNHEEDNDEHYNYPVENMTNNSTIPTQTQVTGANSSTGGGGGKGWKASKRQQDPNATNDDISHITGDDEHNFPHYFFPTRPRPKSALSKLGGNYDSLSVTSGTSSVSPKRVRQKRHSIGETSGVGFVPTKGDCSSGGSSGSVGGGGAAAAASLSNAFPKKSYNNHNQHFHQEQLYDNSEVNRMVVERSMEWNGHADSMEVPQPTLEMLMAADVHDPLLKQVQEALCKQLNSMLQFREQVYHHKKEVKEQERFVQSRQRMEMFNMSKAERQRELSTAVEMNFERRCAHDDRVEIFDSILKAQRLKAIDDIQFVERGSEHFFEGMVVDVKRSSKANSDRDRCVIVRARINGSFDAEIIESGELLINIHPNVIRIPTLPNENETRVGTHEYSVGQKVMCRAGKYGRWFPGFVERILPAGHFKIEFFDGTIEESVSYKRMRPCRRTQEKENDSNTGGFDIALVENEYYLGQEVLMRFPFGCKWRLCTITKVRGDGEAYDVLLNGRQEAEKGVSPTCLRHQGSLLYGYGQEYCPSRRALNRCVSHHLDGSSQEQQDHPNSQDRVFVNQEGEYALRTPQGKSNPIRHNTTGKKSNRQVEDCSMLAVSRSDRLIGMTQIITPSKEQEPATKLPLKKEKGMVPAPSANIRVVANPAANGLVISTMRDRFVQEMHRNVSLLNTSATERKFARIIRQERNRLDSIVRIQATARGYITRSKMKHVSALDRSSKHLQGDEFDLSKAQIDLMDRYMQALSVVVFKNDTTTESNPSPSRPDAASSIAAMRKVAELITTNSPMEYDLEDAVEVNLVDSITDPVEKMKYEMMEIHQLMLKKQRDDMKELFAAEMKGLGSQLMKNMIQNEDQPHQSFHNSFSSPHINSAVESFRQSGGMAASASLVFQNDLSQSQERMDIVLNNTQSRVTNSIANEEDVYIFGIDETVVQDIDWMKDMYLEMWGNSKFIPVEVLSILTVSSTHFSILEGNVPDEMCPVVRLSGGSGDFVDSHQVYFVKSPDNKQDFSLKVRLDNATGKACKLKCPGDRMSDLCENGKTVKITMDSKNQFEISSSSLRLDLLGQCLESLWDAHVAWIAQRLLLRIALHRVIQGISALFLTFPQAEMDEPLETCHELDEEVDKDEHKRATTTVDTTNNVKEENGKKDIDANDLDGVVEEEEVAPNSVNLWGDYVLRANSSRWISHRYMLFQELSSILLEGQEHFRHYQESTHQTQLQLTSLIQNWRFSSTSTTSSATGVPAYDLSTQLYHLANSVFIPYDVFFTSDGSVSHVDCETIKENIQATYNQDTVHPILRGIYVDFVANYALERVFGDFCLGPLMTLSLQKLVKGFAYCETYEWQSLCAHSKTWAYLLHGREADADQPSPKVLLAHERFLEILLQANEIVCQQEMLPEGGGGGGGEEGGEEHAGFEETRESQTGFLQVIEAIEGLTSRILMNSLE